MEKADQVTAPIRCARVYVPGMLHEMGLVSSRSEARRLIKQGGVSVYDPIDREPWRIEDDTIHVLDDTIFKVGKRKWARVRMQHGEG